MRDHSQHKAEPGDWKVGDKCLVRTETDDLWNPGPPGTEVFTITDLRSALGTTWACLESKDIKDHVMPLKQLCVVPVIEQLGDLVDE